MKKVCTKCGVEKPITNFSLTKVRGRSIRRSWCGDCLKIYYKTYRAAKAKEKEKEAKKVKKVKK